MQQHHEDDPRSSLRLARRLVIKIGSRALLDEHERLDERFVGSLVTQIGILRGTGREVVCVSSGAVAAGLGDLDLAQRPSDLPTLQAAAAVGQARLMELYRRLFAAQRTPVAQVLLTHADLRSRERHLNARNTFSRLLQAGVLPIVNENDTVAVDEIRVGDNDLLSALVAMLLRTDVLVMLTTGDGLLTRAPGEGGVVLGRVDGVTDEIRAMAQGADDGVGTGGMRTKVEAAEMVTRCGELAVIANARAPEVLTRLFAGEPLGTVFVPRPGRLAGRKRWIAFFDRPKGAIHVDVGAARALSEQGGSLLAVGIVRIDGSFERGDPVRIVDGDGADIARGLVNYGADDLRRIRGRPSSEMPEILGQPAYPEVVHRDNLVLA